jgi:DNA-directed RNA polymerase specialized sigma24 family protein
VTIATADEFESYRPRMFGLAYRMLGPAEEAEDTVRDAYPRWSGAYEKAAGHVAGMGGPKVRTALDLARAYLRASGRRRPVVEVRLAGKAYKGMRDGGHLTLERAVGKGTFEEFLARRFSAS